MLLILKDYRKRFVLISSFSLIYFRLSIYIGVVKNVWTLQGNWYKNENWYNICS